MVYKNFYISITESNDIYRTDSDGNMISCEGFSFEIFPTENRTQKIDEFSAAVGYEILEKSLSEAEQFVKDHIDLEGSELKGFITEIGSSDDGGTSNSMAM